MSKTVALTNLQYAVMTRRVLPYAMEIFNMLKENCTDDKMTHFGIDMVEFRKEFPISDVGETVMLNIIEQFLKKNYVVQSLGFPYSNENKDVEDDSMIYITYKKKSTAVCRSQ